MDEMNFTIFSLIYSVRLKVKSIFFQNMLGIDILNICV